MIDEDTPGPDPSLGEDGFLKTLSEWTRSKARELAEKNDIGPLTDNHWKVIEFVKEYYETNGTAVPCCSSPSRYGPSEACRSFWRGSCISG
jgi:tRNA 2-thiouridine synthesizing protein E